MSRDNELYKRDIEPKLTAEQRQRRDEQARQIRDRNARRTARRAHVLGAP